MNHPVDLLPDYVLGELSAVETALVERHVDSCEQCSAELRGLNEALVGLTEVLTTAQPPEHAWSAIQGRIKRRPARLTPRQRPAWQSLALAASVIIALSGLWWGFQTRQIYQQVQQEQRKVAGWLSRPDVNAAQLTDVDGERLGSILTLSDGRALFILRSKPPSGLSYQAWGYEGGTAIALGLSDRTLLEVRYVEYDALELSLEPRRGSNRPTQSLVRIETPKDTYN